MRTEKVDSTQNERSRKPSLTLIEVLVAVIVVGVLAVVFVPKIIRRQREDAVARAFVEIRTASPARAKELIAAFPELVNITELEGRIPLHYAASDGDNTGMARYHRKLWMGGSTLLDYAASDGHKDIAELLLEHGADVNAEDRFGFRPLHWAAHYGHKDVAELLLANGADMNPQEWQGLTPLHWAALEGHKDVAELLLAKGADVNAKDNEGRTPLAVAEEYGHTELVELLKKHGAEESE